MQRGEHLFKSVHQALESTFNTLATAESIKAAAYGVQVANSTDKKASKTAIDRQVESVWIMSKTREALGAAQMAWVTCTYVGDGPDREAALDWLCVACADLHKNKALLRACIAREFIYGETYCPSFAQVGKDNGSSESAAGRLGIRVRNAMRELGREVDVTLRKAFAGRSWLPERKAA